MNEPIVEIRDFLRTRLTDPNSVGRDIEEWVFTFFPRFGITIDSFPLISVTQINELGEPFSLGSTVYWQTFQIQIDVWIKEDHILTMGGTQREGKESALYLARQVQEAFRKYFISDLASTSKFGLYRMTGKRPIVYDFQKKVWRLTMTIELERDISDGWV